MHEKLIKSRTSVSNLLVPVPVVVTTKSKDDIPNAFTLSFFTAIHWNPPAVILSLDKKHKSTNAQPTLMEPRGYKPHK